MFVGGILWPESDPGGEGRYIYRKCPGTEDREEKLAFWRCDPGGRWYGSPNFDGCVSNEIKELERLLENKETPVEEVSGLLVNASSSLTVGAEITRTTQLAETISLGLIDQLENITDPQERLDKTEQVTKDVSAACSVLLDSSQAQVWSYLSTDEKVKAASDVIGAVERSAEALAQAVTEAGSDPVTEVYPNLALEAQSVAVNKPAQLPSPYVAGSRPVDTAQIPTAVLEQVAPGQAAVGLSYVNYWSIQSVWLDGDSLNGSRLNTGVMSLTIAGTSQSQNLKQDILLTFKSTNTSNRSPNRTCSYWNFDESAWSTDGCRLHSSNATHTTCACSHLTNFAVLFSLEDDPHTEEEELALEIITYVGLSISIVCLLLSFLTFTCCRGLKGDRNTIHKNLTITLCLADLAFLLSIFAIHSEIGCKVTVGLLQYLFTAAFFWMLVEGIHLYFMLVEVFDTGRSHAVFYYLIGYVTPLVIVGVTFGISGGLYSWAGLGKLEKHCWLTNEHYMIWAFAGPVALILLVNMVMLTVAVRMMCRHARSSSSIRTNQIEKSKGQQIQNEETDSKIAISGYLKGAWVLVLLLGLTWVFGFLYMIHQTVWLAYVFAIFNVLQGLFIFVFYCCKNDKVKKEYQRYVRRSSWVPECIRKLVLGGTYDVNTSQQRTSSTGRGGVWRLFTKKKRLEKKNHSTDESSMSANRKDGALRDINGEELGPLKEMEEIKYGQYSDYDSGKGSSLPPSFVSPTASRNGSIMTQTTQSTVVASSPLPRSYAEVISEEPLPEKQTNGHTETTGPVVRYPPPVAPKPHPPAVAPKPPPVAPKPKKHYDDFVDIDHINSETHDFSL